MSKLSSKNLAVQAFFKATREYIGAAYIFSEATSQPKQDCINTDNMVNVILCN